MQKRFIFIVVLAGAPMLATASCATISKTLVWGMKDRQVTTLQRMLNKDPTTRVAASGAGAAGHESMYFGKATMAAVKVFQKANTATILAPAGLSKPNGVVGKLTRAALTEKYCPNEISSAAATPASTTASVTKLAEPPKLTPQQVQANIVKQVADNAQYMNAVADLFSQKMKLQQQIHASASASTSTPAPASAPVASTTSSLSEITGTADRYPLQIFTLSNNVVRRGDVLTIAGTGFSKSIQLSAGGRNYPLLPGTGADTARFVVPLDMPLDLYHVTLVDGARSSLERTLIVTDDPSNQPTITSISPQTGNVGSTFVLHGTRFAPANEIITTFGIIHGVASSNGTDMSFTLPSLASSAGAAASLSTSAHSALPSSPSAFMRGVLPSGLKDSVYVMNKYGVSKIVTVTTS